MDRGRPLWEMHLVRGLPEGRTGLIMKLHHAVLDGPSGAELMVQLLDMEPAPPVAGRGVDPSPADPQPSRIRPAGRGSQAGDPGWRPCRRRSAPRGRCRGGDRSMGS